jgi:iron complex outermembrane receptor protein
MMNVQRSFSRAAMTPSHRIMRATKGARAAVGWLLLVSVSHVALGQTVTPAAGQNAQAPADATPQDQTHLEDIIVTANRRQETLLRAPVAVSALSPVTLQTAGIVGVQDLNSVAPNTEVRTVGVDNGLLFAIRGVTDTEFNDAANPAVATYFDGVYVGRTEGIATMLFDLERIEILRGPQGTLYGRNSTGGNVNILTASPKHSFDASADLSYGNYNDIQARAMINVPVSDTIAIRGAVAYHRNDGYYDTKGTTVNNYGKSDDYAGRVTILWTPTDGFKWRLSVDDFVSHGTPSLDSLTGPDGKPLNGGSPYSHAFVNIQQPYFFTQPSLNVSNLMVRSRMDLTLSKGVTLSYIAGYQHVKNQVGTVLEFPLSGQTTFAPFFRDTPTKATSQEVDINIDRGRFHNIAGGNYFYQHFYSRGDANNLVGTFFLAHGDALIESYGVFDQATFDVTSALKLTGGVRYSHEKDSEQNAQFTFCPETTYNPPNNTLQSLLGQQFTLPGCFITVGAIPVNLKDASVSASHVDYRAGLEYSPTENTSAYFTVSSGYKAGGLNLGAPTRADLIYRPENVTNYELGVKTRLLNNRLGINSAFFYTDYKDIQTTQLDRSATADVTTNAGGARIYGAELEAQWQISNNDRLSASFNYLHATYTNFANVVDQLTGTTYTSLRGNRLPFTPRFSGRVEYNHEIPLANGGKIVGTAALYYQTANFLREFNLPIDRVPGYTKSDIQLQYIFPKKTFTVTGYVHNLEDHAIRNGAFPYLGGYLSSYNQPRTYGVRLSYKY